MRMSTVVVVVVVVVVAVVVARVGKAIAPKHISLLLFLRLVRRGGKMSYEATRVESHPNDKSPPPRGYSGE